MKRYLVIIAITALLLVPIVVRTSQLENLKPVYATGILNKTDIARLVNEERVKVGVAPLIRDSRLDQSAQRKAHELTREGIINGNAHKNKAGVSGNTYIVELAPECAKISTSENLLYNTYNNEAGVYSWMNSKAHHDAMLGNNITIVGYGISGRYVIQHMC